MSPVATSRSDRDCMRVVPCSGCVHVFPVPSISTGCRMIRIRRIRSAISMVVIAVGATAGTVAMRRHLISRERTDSMSVFQILKNNVFIIDGDKSYTDTVDNFLADVGAVSVPESVIYDDSQECCVVDGTFLGYPNATYSGYGDRIQALLDAQAKRTYVAPAAPTPEEQKASIKADYDSAVKELSDSMAVALLTGDTDAQASIRADFADLQAQYKEAMENV